MAPSGAKYRAKGWAVTKTGDGVIDKRILELLTFGSNPDFVDFWLKKLNFQAVIKSAASAASPIAWGEPPGRRPSAEAVVLALPKQSGRLDHGLRV